MIWLLFSLVVFVVMFREIVLDADGFLGAILALVFTAAASFMAAVLAWGFAGVVGMIFDARVNGFTDTQLIAIRDKDGIHGSFFLGSGSVDAQPYLFFYTQTQDGAITPGKVKLDDSVRIYEEERKDAIRRTLRYTFEHPLAWIVGLPGFDAPRNEFHVPEGTVRRGFTL